MTWSHPSRCTTSFGPRSRTPISWSCRAADTWSRWRARTRSPGCWSAASTIRLIASRARDTHQFSCAELRCDDSSRGGANVYEGFALADFWNESDYATEEYVDAAVSDVSLAMVEAALKYKLPASYV